MPFTFTLWDRCRYQSRVVVVVVAVVLGVVVVEVVVVVGRPTVNFHTFWMILKVNLLHLKIGYFYVQIKKFNDFKV